MIYNNYYYRNSPSTDAFTSSTGVHFTSVGEGGGGDPHGMPCVREVLRFLIAIINPRDKYILIVHLSILLYYLLEIILITLSVLDWT